jgi:hypothetical protein
MARACLSSQWGKVHRHVQLQPAAIPVLYSRFCPHTCGLGWAASSLEHAATVIGRTSRRPEAILLSCVTAADCVRALLAGWPPILVCQPLLPPTEGLSYVCIVGNPLQTAPEPCLPAGSPILERQPLSPPSEGLSLCMHYGQPTANCSISSILPPQHTAPNPTTLVEHF